MEIGAVDCQKRVRELVEFKEFVELMEFIGLGWVGEVREKASR